MDAWQERQERTEWFRDARFGMFIHWGVYAIPARGEWVRSFEKITLKDYQPFLAGFNPTEYRPKEWAKLAREAGMKYAVLTAKHHDGFCLFDSALTEYKATNTPAGRDLVREYVEAFRTEGLAVGLYYSLPDWQHPDFPSWKDLIHPLRDDPSEETRPRNFDNYVKYLHGQVRELLTGYGKIDILWFDFSYEDLTGEKWKAAELVEMARALQPGIIIDNRLGGNMHEENPVPYTGDFEGPEQIIPREVPVDVKGRPIPWESCITLNNSWGYNAMDNDYKTAGEVIRTLVNCVSKNGNLLINVGPDALGRIPEKAASILKEVGAWLAANGESIYGCREAGLPRPDWGRWTRKGDVLYAHLMEKMVGQYNLPGMKGKIDRAIRLMDGAESILGGFWNGDHANPDSPDDLFLGLTKPTQKTCNLPDPRDTVIRMSLKTE